MSLQLCRRHGSPYWYVRGSIRGLRIDKSTGLAERKPAQEFLALYEAELIKESIHGPQSVRTFADAALSYVEAGGERKHLRPLVEHFGLTKLASIDANHIDRVAKKLSRMASGEPKGPATMNRQIYTPIAAILHHAAHRGWCPKPVIRRPKQPEGRVRWITHDEAQLLIEAAADHLKPLLVFMLSTGARVSEALYLDWRELDLDASRVILKDTKNGETRGVPLVEEAKAALAELPHREGAVFRRPDGAPYVSREGEGGGQLKTGWKGMLKRAGISNFHPHDCRHTWASWHYSLNRDPFALMVLGGWKSEKMVARYAHVNPDGLAGTMANLWGKSGGALTANTKNTNHIREVA